MAHMQFISTDLSDLDEILSLAKSCFVHFHSKERVLDRLKDKKYWIYVAKDYDKIIAFKIWYEDSDGQIYSWLGGVHPDYRRRGIAQELMNIQFKLSKSHGYSKIKLKTHYGHPEMIALCKKNGFVQVKFEPDHWGPGREAIFFEKII